MPRQHTNYGPSLVGGGTPAAEIKYLSVSQIERFDDAVEGGCNRKWYFRHVLRAPEPQRRSQKLGEQVHAQIEHYLRTGEDVLGDVARAGRRFLPRPGPDLLVEYEFAWLEDARGVDDRTVGPVRGRVASKLIAGGTPVIGYVDLMHRRDEWVDDSGAVRANSKSAEVVDWKTSKQVDDVVEEETGVVVKRGYAKTAEALVVTHQMAGYGELARLEYPGIESVRLGHGYFQTQGPRAASKRSSAVPVSEIAERWSRTGAIVEKMRAVARAGRVEDVALNLSACSAYGGCAFLKSCPRDPAQVLAGIFRKGEAMSLLDRMKQRNAEKKVAPSAPPQAADSAVESEKKKLLAEEAAAGRGITPPDAPAPQKTHEPIPAEAPAEVQKFAQAQTAAWSSKCACGETVTVTAANGSKLADGTVKHLGCGYEPKAAAPVAAGACIPAGQRELTTDEAVEKKLACACGATIKLKPQKMDGRWFAMVPPHESKLGAAPTPAVKIKIEGSDGKMRAPEDHAAFEAAKTVSTAQPSFPTPEQIEEVLPLAQGALGFNLYFDASEDGVAIQRLEPYVEKLCAALCDQYKAADVRCAPNDGPLAFGKWKGAVAALAKAGPPPPGNYAVSSASEIGVIVFEALAPLAQRVMRKA